MIWRGLFTLEELEQAEATKKAEATRLEEQASALFEASSLLGGPLLGPKALTDLPESFWANLGFSGTASPLKVLVGAFSLYDWGASCKIPLTGPGS